MQHAAQNQQGIHVRTCIISTGHPPVTISSRTYVGESMLIMPATPSTVPWPPAVADSYPTALSSSAMLPTTMGAAATPNRPQASQPLSVSKGFERLKLKSCCCFVGLYLQQAVW
jgi:hypothetical protein